MAGIPQSHDDAEGSFAPFVVAMRQHTTRHGPQSWPLSGTGCFVVLLDGDVTIFFESASQLQEKTGLKEHLPYNTS